MLDPTVRRAAANDAADIELLEREARGALIGQRGGERWWEKGAQLRVVEQPAAGIHVLGQLCHALTRLTTARHVLVLFCNAHSLPVRRRAKLFDENQQHEDACE